METTLHFTPSVLENNQCKINSAIWNPVLDAYDKKKYKETIISLLRYVDEGLLEKAGGADQTEFTIPHGSTVVNISIKNDEFAVTAPFLKLPAEGSIALLRQIAQLNFHPLMLTRIVLDEQNQLTFRYSCPLELCEPYKVYDVLREICTNADKYDDTFITKFKAEAIREPEIKFHPEAVQEAIWGQVNNYITEGEQLVQYFEQKRWNDFILDAYIIVLLKIDYYCAPQGYLRSEIEEIIRDLYSNELPMNERIHKGKVFFNKIKNYDKTKLLKDIYMAEVFIPYKYTSNIESVRNDLERFHPVAKKEIADKNYLAATLTLQRTFLRLFYYYHTTPEIERLLIGSLLQSSGQSWENAARQMWEAMETVMSEEKYNNYIKQQNLTV